MKQKRVLNSLSLFFGLSICLQASAEGTRCSTNLTFSESSSSAPVYVYNCKDGKRGWLANNQVPLLTHFAVSMYPKKGPKISEIRFSISLPFSLGFYALSKPSDIGLTDIVKSQLPFELLVLNPRILWAVVGFTLRDQTSIYPNPQMDVSGRVIDPFVSRSSNCYF